MQGQIYHHQITAGPFRGRACRILDQPPRIPDWLKVKIQGEAFQFLIPMRQIVPRNGHNKTRRPSNGSRNPSPARN